MSETPIPHAIDNRHGGAVRRLLSQYSTTVVVETEWQGIVNGYDAIFTIASETTDATVIQRDSPVLEFPDIGGAEQDVNALAWFAEPVEIYDSDAADEDYTLDWDDLESIAEADDSVDSPDEISHLEGEIGNLSHSTVRYAGSTDGRRGPTDNPDAGTEFVVEGMTREQSGINRVSLS